MHVTSVSLAALLFGLCAYHGQQSNSAFDSQKSFASIAENSFIRIRQQNNLHLEILATLPVRLAVFTLECISTDLHHQSPFLLP